MNKQRTAIAVLSVSILALVAAWALGMFQRTDPEVAELEQIRDQMFANRDVPREEQRQQFNAFRQRMDSLSDAQRQQVWQSGREQFMLAAQERMDEFFALPPDQQQERLDEIIDRMVERQQRRDQNPQGDRGRGPGRGNWQNMSETQRDALRKQRLDWTNPKMRAQFSEFRRMMDERMEARGLPPNQGGFGGWGRGG